MTGLRQSCFHVRPINPVNFSFLDTPISHRQHAHHLVVNKSVSR